MTFIVKINTTKITFNCFIVTETFMMIKLQVYDVICGNDDDFYR